MKKQDLIFVRTAGPDGEPAAEEGALAALAAAVPAAPERDRLLSRAYASPEANKECTMSVIHRILLSRRPLVRYGLALLLVLGIAALSLLLPRGVKWTGSGLQLQGPTPAYAATEGYLLIYEFSGENPDAIKPIVDQLLAKVREFKLAHKLPVEENKSRRIRLYASDTETKSSTASAGGEDAPKTETKSKCKLIVAVALENTELLDELKEELKSIPGLPEPTVTDSTWFQKDGEPLPGEGANQLSIYLGDKEHTFNFSPETSPEEMEQAIRAWLEERAPGKKFDVEVEKDVQPDGKTEFRVEIKSVKQESGAQP